MKTVKQRVAMWNRRGYINRTPGGCILWVGHRNKKGYGQIGIGNKSHLVHKWLWEQFRGPVQGMLCHTCDTPNCIKLAHMYDGTNAQNQQDWKDRKRPSTFPCGHDRVGNTITYTDYRPDRPNPTKHDRCILCKREQSRESRRRRRSSTV